MEIRYGAVRRAGIKYDYFSSPGALAAWSVVIIMAMEAFAVYFNGAFFQNAMTLCVITSWSVALVLLFANRGEILADWTFPQKSLLALTGAFWLWTGLSMLWSISRDATWIEFNRTGGYTALFFVGIVIGRHRFARRLAVVLFMLVVTAASIYGLGPKAFPDVIVNLEDLGRISVPIGYANAMGLLIALGYVFSIYISAARDFHWTIRLISMLAGPLIIICMFFTTSRGAAIALITGLVVYFAAVPIRLRSFGVMLLSLVPTYLLAVWSSEQNALMRDKVDMADRILTATSLRSYLLEAILLPAIVFSVALILGSRITVPARATRVVGAFVLISVLLLIIGSASLFAASKPSFSDWASQAYHEFRYGWPSQYGAARFFEMGGSGRWRIWEEAIANWRDNLIAGSGGQSFPVTHLIRREAGTAFVKQAHGHPFQLLTELGLIGYLLSMSFITASLAFCTLHMCRLRGRWDRAMAGAILSVIVIYLIHAAYDWDWNLYSLTLVWFFFTGLLIGWPDKALGDRSVAQNDDVSDPVSHVSGKPS